MHTHTIATTIHGRYLTRVAGRAGRGILVGFHGQSETAAIELEHLRDIRGDRPWTLVSVQGLHRYYTRRGDVVAAWMTREDRELAIADNIAYVRRRPRRSDAIAARAGAARSCAAASRRAPRWPTATAAFAESPRRRADHPRRRRATRRPAARRPRCRPSSSGGARRRSGTPRRRRRSTSSACKAAGVVVIEHVFDGGHVRHPSFAARAGRFLDEIREDAGPGTRRSVGLSLRADREPDCDPAESPACFASRAMTVNGDDPSALLLTRT